MVVHRQRDGSWAPCVNPAACELLFHVDGATAAELEAMPLALLLPLLEAMDPPTHDDGWEKRWTVPNAHGDGEIEHRDYDLPSRIRADGTMYWRQRGQAHRDHDRPAMIRGDGGLMWCQLGDVHRVGQPAIIRPDGTVSYYEWGRKLHAGDPSRSGGRQDRP